MLLTYPPKSVLPLAVVLAGVTSPCGPVRIVLLAPYAIAARFLWFAPAPCTPWSGKLGGGAGAGAGAGTEGAPKHMGIYLAWVLSPHHSALSRHSAVSFAAGPPEAARLQVIALVVQDFRQRT